MQSLNILHTVSSYPPSLIGGGASHVVRHLSEELASRGHNVTVATSYSPERSDGTILNGVRVRHFRVHGILNQSVLGICGDKTAFLRFLKDEPFDIIMNYAAQTWHTDLTCRCLPSLKARTVLATCGYSGLVGWRRPLYWCYFHKLPRYLRLYDAVVYHANKYRDQEFGAGHGISNYRIIPNGIDASEFAKSAIDFRACYGIRTPHIILTVGDHYRNKGHNRVLDAVARLNRPDVTLVLIGCRVVGWPRSCWNDCQRASRRMEGRVLMLDNLPRTHVAAAYVSATLFVSGSYIEVFPLVILEAMASGLPFVAYPAGNIADLPGGLTVSSTAEMVATIQRFLDAPSERTCLGAAGQCEQQRHYEWKTVVDQYEALYRELLDRSPRQVIP